MESAVLQQGHDLGWAGDVGVSGATISQMTGSGRWGWSRTVVPRRSARSASVCPTPSPRDSGSRMGTGSEEGRPEPRVSLSGPGAWEPAPSAQPARSLDSLF